MDNLKALGIDPTSDTAKGLLESLIKDQIAKLAKNPELRKRVLNWLIGKFFTEQIGTAPTAQPSVGGENGPGQPDEDIGVPSSGGADVLQGVEIQKLVIKPMGWMYCKERTDQNQNYHHGPIDNDIYPWSAKVWLDVTPFFEGEAFGTDEMKAADLEWAPEIVFTRLRDGAQCVIKDSGFQGPDGREMDKLNDIGIGVGVTKWRSCYGYGVQIRTHEETPYEAVARYINPDGSGDAIVSAPYRFSVS